MSEPQNNRPPESKDTAYVRAAQPGKLTDWIVGALDKAAGYSELNKNEND